ncbi:MAG: TetR/AcrR family transcriptional regulator [Gordonia amarae]
MTDAFDLDWEGLRRVPQQARSRERLLQVLAAAERILVNEGAAMLTTTRVAQEAGVSVASLYQYLPDRDAIIETLADTYLHRLENRMRKLLRSAGQHTWSDPVGILFDAFVDAYRAEDGFRALWFSRSLTDATQAADREHKRRMAQMLREILMQQGIAETPRLDVVARSAHLVADTMLQEAFRADPEGDDALIEEAKTILRGYLREYLATAEF